jgi:predicted lactoylglutathione lyase
MNTTIDFTRINNDINGNPRYVCHYSEFINDNDKETARKMSQNLKPFCFFVEHEYNIALNKARKIGGRKFNNKQYGGGIVFQSYNIGDLENHINELKNS